MAGSRLSPLEPRYDVVVVGAGFAGLYMLHALRRRGFSVRVFEAGEGVGGTWYWNRYPGARCDIESMEYSYQFDPELQQEWEWSERYATQPEILRYLDHVADRFDLRTDIQLGTRVEAATFDDGAARWTVRLDSGEEVSAQHVVMATGCLSSANLPDIPGLDGFRGLVVHTGRWPHEGVDFSGKRVGVIGTGSSGIQSIPIIAEQAEHLTVFQRTPNYSVPAHNQPLDPIRVKEIKERYPDFRAENAQKAFGASFPVNDVPALDTPPEERRAEYDRRWAAGGLGFMSSFNDLLIVKEANETAAEYLREKIRSIVRDPEVAAKLQPTHEVGCKRLCVDTDYFATYNRDDVRLVDVSEAPITRITPDGLDAGGEHHVLDVIVFATGFDAMTGAVLAIDVRGRGGRTLRDKWSAGPRTYLGLCTEGFPNLFTITGPGSPSVLTNMVPSIEQHVNWITDCIANLRDRGHGTIEASREAEDAWVDHVNAVASFTLFPSCNSWYLGANVPGKQRVFMPLLGFPPYVEKCDEVASKGYEGFALA